MNVLRAKAVAAEWVAEFGATLPGYRGAYFAGSVRSLPDDATLPPGSDVDVMVVLHGGVPIKIGKLLRDGVLMEVSFIPAEELSAPEAVLGKYHLASGLASAEIIADPGGELASLQSTVARDFVRRRWVMQRCADAHAKVEAGLAARVDGGALHDQVLQWVFPTGVMTHVLLVAGLRNPTVRRRYEAVKGLLSEFGEADLYEPLLDALGCAAMTRPRVERHLEAVADVFDAAAKVTAAPFPFATDISPCARPIAIDGSRDLMDRGFHREAVFWLVVTYSRAMKMLDFDGGETRPFLPPYLELLNDLGAGSFNAMNSRAAQALALLPRVRAAAERIVAANPNVL